MNYFKNIKDRAVVSWRAKSGSEKKQVIKTCLVLGAICICFAMYGLKDGTYSKSEKNERPVIKRTIEQENYIDRDIDARIEARVQIEVAAALANHRMNNSITQPIEKNESLDDLDFDSSSENSTPVTNSSANSYPVYQDDEHNYQVEVEPSPEFIGGISWEQASLSQKKIESGEVLSKITIPVGFMPAMMIVGVQAPVSTSGRSNPKPIHLRVQAPATLPNKIKMNLAGCFVIANTWGNLASERIEAETATLTCMTQDKKTIISGQLHGYLADDDGQRDIAGRVVTKAGALLGRQFFADTLSGAGSAISKNTGEVAMSPLGSVTTLTGSEVAQQGLASGVGKGFSGAAEFISELISQSGPIIESGAARKVMIMVQKESVLEIKTVESYEQLSSTN